MTASQMTGPSSGGRCSLATLVLAAAVFAPAIAACAQGLPDEADKAWQENALELPQAPLPANLLPFHVSPTATQSFALDATSISVGKDGVVRYTLVSVSKGGARNVSYEGMRCDLRLKRSYAFGRSDGTWSAARREAWDPLGGNAPNNPHPVLFNDFLCKDKKPAGSASQIADLVRRHGGIGMRGISDFTD